VDFLVGKGFNKDDLKPTAKLTEDMYRSLQQEFQGDKVAKIKSNQIDLPKGSVEAKRKKEDETVLFRKDPNKKPAKEEPAPVVVVEEVKPVVVAKVEEPKKEPETIKIEAPEIEGPKIIDKIDLSQIDSSTRPKKTAKKKEPEVKVETPEKRMRQPSKIYRLTNWKDPAFWVRSNYLLKQKSLNSLTKEERENAFPSKKGKVVEIIMVSRPVPEHRFSQPGRAVVRNPFCEEIFVLRPAPTTGVQLLHATRKKLIKKKFRRRSAKRRPNWPVPVDAAEAVKQNIAVRAGKKMRRPVAANSRKVPNYRLQSLSA
jgi:hypothetical protein